MDLLPTGPADWLFVASFFAPPVLNGIAWWRWSRPIVETRRRRFLTLTGLLLNSAAVATTSFVMVTILVAAILRGGPGEGLTIREGDWVALSVIGASVLSGVSGLLGTSRCRIILVASSLLAGTFWPLLLSHVGVL